MEKKILEMTNCPDEHKRVFHNTLLHFKADFKKKWVAASYKHDRFVKINEKWLESSILLPHCSVQKPGRPSKPFHELSDCSKRRKTKELREQVPVQELSYAAAVSQSTSGSSDASKLIKELISTPTRAKKLRKAIRSARNPHTIKKHTPQEALAIFVEGDFTRRQWEVIHGANKNIYPCYSNIQKAKKECYPKEDAIFVSETCSEVELQALLDHTALRLCKYLEEVLETCSEDELQNLVLLSKWGCDGSHQDQFKQTFQNSTDSDAYIFQSSFVPVKLVVMIHSTYTKTIWQNPVPSSVRFCRPIRIRLIKESPEVIKNEIHHVEHQIKNLKKSEVSASNSRYEIQHKMILTMVDGKVCNAATNTTSTMRCYICNQTSKNFNKLIEVKEVNEDALKFGLSTLHARIRFFELLLHLAYKLPLRKWQVRTAEDKKNLRETKAKIQQAFKDEMGLLVDIPKQGFGTTNDGNTSRRFFDNPECSSRITGINLNLIKKFKVILEVISSGISVDAEKFDLFARETAKMYTTLYNWHPMTPTVHKVLIHGAEVISKAILPIGQLSEEAAEARNKHLRQYRINFARKFSRLDCNRDVLNRLLLSSDPYLSCNRRKHHKNSVPFSKEAIDLMAAPSFPLNENDDRDEAEDSGDSDEEDDE